MNSIVRGNGRFQGAPICGTSPAEVNPAWGPFDRPRPRQTRCCCRGTLGAMINCEFTPRGRAGRLKGPCLS
jgi:hypothetical protein